jgi:hypothetical protein
VSVTSIRQRRGAIDLARVAALVLVVAGHLAMAVIDRGPDGELRGVNVIALYPGAAWLAMLAPMPVFFAAAGWANANATPVSAAHRLHSLVGLAAVVVGAWSLAALLERMLTGDGGVVADGARLATQPLWFLAVYVPFAAAGSALARVARRPWLAVGAGLCVLAALDIARFGAGAPDAIGWAGFAVAWGVPWVIGAAWRQRDDAAHDVERERRTGATLALLGISGAAALVLSAGYAPTLIDAVEGERSNTTPPTLFTAVAAIAQVGLLMVAVAPLDRLAERRRGLLDRMGALSVGIYAWHLTALALCAGLLASGVWAPSRFGAVWWATRPVWFALVLGVTGLLMAATAAVSARLRRHRDAPSVGRAVVGVVLATAGAAVVGRWGPRGAGTALAACTCLTAGWWCLRGPSAARTDQPDGGTGSAPVRLRRASET